MPSMEEQQWATIIGASITASVTLTAALLAYVFGRLQKSFEVRYTTYYERQADILGDLYSLMHNISKGFVTYLAGLEGNDRDEEQLAGQRNTIAEEIEKFRRCYTENDVWISRDTRKELDGLYGELDKQWLSVELPTRGSDVKDNIEGWIETRFPQVRDDLRSQFHKALSIKDDRQSSKGEDVLQGNWRIFVGVFGTTSVGFGVGMIISHLLDNFTVGLVSGSFIGLGVGLLLEYLKPSKKLNE